MHTPAEFGALNASVTDTVLRIIAVVLAGMIGIGYLGLVATLGLATLERRNELVMLRAIGAARAQVRAMVRIEAMLVGLVASVVGLGVGNRPDGERNDRPGPPGASIRRRRPAVRNCAACSVFTPEGWKRVPVAAQLAGWAGMGWLGWQRPGGGQACRPGQAGGAV